MLLHRERAGRVFIYFKEERGMTVKHNTAHDAPADRAGGIRAGLAASAAILIVIMMLILSACGTAGDSSMTSAGRPVEISARDVAADITASQEGIQATTVLSKEDDGYDADFASLYDNLDESLISDGVIAYDATGATADEITILRAKDVKNTVQLESALRARAQKRAADFGNYKPEESSKCTSAKVFTCDSYVMLAICSDPASARTEFQKVMQKAAGM